MQDLRQWLLEFLTAECLRMAQETGDFVTLTPEQYEQVSRRVIDKMLVGADPGKLLTCAGYIWRNIAE